MEKEKMIALAQGQLEAYNRGDIDLFCSFYHPDVTAYSLGTNEPFCKGMNEFRPIYNKRFQENPKLHCELKSRIVTNNSVLDEEWVTGVSNNPNGSHVVAIYQFKDDLIYNIWFAR